MTPNLRQLPLIVIKMILDATAITISSYLAFFVRFDGNLQTAQLETWRSCVVTLVLCRLLAHYVITRYRLQWRYTGLTDFLYLLAAVALGSAFFAATLLLRAVQGYPRGVLLLEAFITLNFLMLARLLVRISRSHSARWKGVTHCAEKRVLVVGAGSAGERIVRQMKEDRAANLKPVGFLDDDPTKLRRLIHGVPVLGRIEEVEAIARDCGADQILLAIPSLSGAGISEIVRACSGARAQLTILPTLPQLLGTGLSTNAIRKVCVEDLMERSPVEMDMDVAAAYTTGQRILVTGAGGSIGGELCRQIAALNPETLVLLGQDENSLYWIDQELRTDYGLDAPIVVADIKDRQRVEAVFRKHRPTVVFHAAAHKHVPMMEANPGEAVKNNVFGTVNVAELAMQYNVRKFVMISTDKAVNPTSVMGTTKRVAEMVVQSFAQRIEDGRLGRSSTALWGFGGSQPVDVRTSFTSVRFGNVLGSNGSVIPTMQKQIEKGGPVTVTHPEMTRYFMTIPEAVQLVIQAGGMGRGGEVFVLDMGKPVRIMDLAWNLIRLSGFVPNVDIKLEITGMRPGEKLYEEVLTAEEGAGFTSHHKIRVARPACFDHVALSQGLERLSRAAHSDNPEEVKDALYALVPSYDRYGSKYNAYPEPEKEGSVRATRTPLDRQAEPLPA